MSRAYNFCAGPATMPEPVLQKAQEELLNWGKKGAVEVVAVLAELAPEFI